MTQRQALKAKDEALEAKDDLLASVRTSQLQESAEMRRDDGLIGKTVRIQAGQWKGYLGTVCDATATYVQVELHSRLKKVMVVRERVAVVGDKFGATEDPDRAAGNPGRNF